MDFDGLEIIKYKGTNNLFMALCKIKKEYYIFVSKVKPPIIELQQDTLTNYFLQIPIKSLTKSASIIIECLVNEKDNTLIKLFKLNNEAEFDTIVNVLGELL